MLNETGIPPVEPGLSNTDYDLKNVVTFPIKSKQPTTFRIPASAITAKFSPGSPEEKKKILSDQEILETQRLNMIPDLCDVYVRELFFKLHALGFDVLSESFDKDLHFVYEALQSSLLRTYGVDHPVQNFVDTNFEVEYVDVAEDEKDPADEEFQIVSSISLTPDEDGPETT